MLAGLGAVASQDIETITPVYSLGVVSIPITLIGGGSSFQSNHIASTYALNSGMTDVDISFAQYKFIRVDYEVVAPLPVTSPTPCINIIDFTNSNTYRLYLDKSIGRRTVDIDLAPYQVTARLGFGSFPASGENEIYKIYSLLLVS